MTEKSLKAATEQVANPNPQNEGVTSRRKLLRNALYFGLGGFIGVASTPAKAGLMDSLLSIIKKLLQAAVVGIALFYAWRYIKNVSESVSTWLENQTANEEDNGEDETIIQAKYADYVNLGNQVIANAEIMADYEPPEDACDVKSIGQISTSIDDWQKVHNAALLKKHFDFSINNTQNISEQNTLRKEKVRAITNNANRLLDTGRLLIRRGYSELEKQEALAQIELLTGSIYEDVRYDPSGVKLTAKEISTTSLRSKAKEVLTDIVTKRIKSPEFTDEFINAQSDEQLKSLARNASANGGLSYVDMLMFEGNRNSITEYNVGTMSKKAKPTPIYKKMLYVRSSTLKLQNEYVRLVKARKSLEASNLISTVGGI
jgi:hypothetical protein